MKSDLGQSGQGKARRYAPFPGSICYFVFCMIFRWCINRYREQMSRNRVVRPQCKLHWKNPKLLGKKYGFTFSTSQTFKKGSYQRKFNDCQGFELLEYLFHVDDLFYVLTKTEFLKVVYMEKKTKLFLLLNTNVISCFVSVTVIYIYQKYFSHLWTLPHIRAKLHHYVFLFLSLILLYRIKFVIIIKQKYKCLNVQHQINRFRLLCALGYCVLPTKYSQYQNSFNLHIV